MSEINIVLCLDDKRVSSFFKVEESFGQVYDKIVELFSLEESKFVCELNGRIVHRDIIVQESEATNECEIVVKVDKEETLEMLMLSYIISNKYTNVIKDVVFMEVISRLLSGILKDDEAASILKMLSKFDKWYDTNYYKTRKEETYGQNDEEFENLTGDIFGDLLIYFTRKDDDMMINLIKPYLVLTSKLIRRYIYEPNARVDVVIKFIELGADINAGYNWCRRGETMLMMACCMGHFRIVKYLLENGADVNLHTGSSPLYHAINGRYIDTVKELSKRNHVIGDILCKNSLLNCAQKSGERMTKLVSKIIEKSKRQNECTSEK